MVETFKKEYPGFGVAAAIAVVALFLSNYTPSWVNSILLALVIGILIGNFVEIPKVFSSGISFTSSKMLELSVLFLAFSINFTHIAKLGVSSFVIVATMVLFMVVFTYSFSNKIKCPEKAGWLIGFGTAICGSSAIAALSPIVAKEHKNSVGISMAVVNLAGTIAMIVMPLVLINFDLSANQMGMILGGTLHSVGNVAGSAFSVSNEVGETAITIKLARVALLTPGLLLFNYLVHRNTPSSSVQPRFSLPWYLWGFIGITILGSLISYPKELVGAMEWLGKIILTIAMAAIGLKISFKSLMNAGRKGVMFGLIVYGIQLVLMLFLMKAFQII